MLTGKPDRPPQPADILILSPPEAAGTPHYPQLRIIPHVGMAGGKPHPYPARQRDHRGRPPDSAATAAVSVAGSTAPVIRICMPLQNAISIVPPVLAQAAHPDGSGATETAANCTSLSCRSAFTAPNDPVRACRRQPSANWDAHHAVAPHRRRSPKLPGFPRRSEASRSSTIVAAAPDPTKSQPCSRSLICLQINQQTIAGKVAARKVAPTGPTGGLRSSANQ